MVTESEKDQKDCEVLKKSVSDQLMVRENERDRVIARISEKEREGVRGTV